MIESFWHLAPALPVLTIHGPFAGAKELRHMATQTLKAKALLEARKLDGEIDGKPVYVRDLVNDDLDENDEIRDQWAEINRQRLDVLADIDESDDPDERRDMRARGRGLARELRTLDTTMLGLYVESADGERYPMDVLEQVPVRVQTALIRQAMEKIYGSDDEGPTPPLSGSG
jgi:hypothetical protein